MNQLNPGEKHIICRQLEDPTDTTTYYVRAYIRKADGDDLIATVNLTDKTEQRFRGEWYVSQYNVPVEITITTKVFTDSGYTTESNLYGRVEEIFLISPRWSHVFGSGGGGSDLSYKKIKEIIKEEIQNIKPAEKIDLNPVFVAIEGIVKTIKAIKIPEYKEQKIEFPEQKEFNAKPLLEELEIIKSYLTNLKNTDLNPLTEHISQVKNETIKNIFVVKDLIEKVLPILSEISEERLSRGKLAELKKSLEIIPTFREEVKPKRRSFI